MASGTSFGGDGRVWLGWACVLVATHLGVWPLAAALTRLPGLRHVL